MASDSKRKGDGGYDGGGNPSSGGGYDGGGNPSSGGGYSGLMGNADDEFVVNYAPGKSRGAKRKPERKDKEEKSRFSLGDDGDDDKPVKSASGRGTKRKAIDQGEIANNPLWGFLNSWIENGGTGKGNGSAAKFDSGTPFAWLPGGVGGKGPGGRDPAPPVLTTVKIPDNVFVQLSVPQHRSGRTIQGHPRHDPVMPQAAIVQTTAVDKNLPKRRRRDLEEHRLVPVGTESSFNVLKGDLMFEDHSVQTRRKNGQRGPASYPSRSLVNVVNGATAASRFTFVGGACTEVAVDNDNSDNLMVTQVGGTFTTMHTGWSVIPERAKVYFSTVPFTNDDRSSGAANKRMVPAIEFPGRADGTFQPSLFSLDVTAVSTYMARAEARVTRCAREHVTSNSGRTTQQFFDAADAAVTAMYHSDGIYGEIQPIQLYARWAIAEAAMAADSIGHGLGPEFRKYVQEIMKDQAKCRDRRADAAFETFGSKLALDDHTVVGLILAGNANTIPLDEARLILREHIANNKNHCVDEYHRWFDEHYVGRSLSTSAPGHQLDLLLATA